MSAINVSFSGSVPENYERYLGPLLFEPYAIDLVSRIPSGAIAQVVELACGTGRVTRHLRAVLPPSVKLIATDLNPDMIRVARSKMSESNMEWLQVDMQALPFPDESVDCVVCQFGIMFVPDKPKAFREAFRVLKKGGTFLFNTWDEINNNGVFAVANAVVTKFFNDNPPTFYQTPFSMYRPAQLEELSRDAGFTKVDVQLVKKTGVSESALFAAKGVIEGSPILNEIMQIDPHAVEPLVQQVAAAVGKKFGDHPLNSPLQAWVGSATR